MDVTGAHSPFMNPSTALALQTLRALEVAPVCPVTPQTLSPHRTRITTYAAVVLGKARLISNRTLVGCHCIIEGGCLKAHHHFQFSSVTFPCIFLIS